MVGGHGGAQHTVGGDGIHPRVTEEARTEMARSSDGEGGGAPGAQHPPPSCVCSCPCPPHGALTLFPPQPRWAPAALRQEQ